MGTCDVCNASITLPERTIYSASEFKNLVSKGFEPDEATIARRIKLLGESRRSVIARWAQGTVAASKTDWLLCESCAARAEKSLSGQASESKNTKTQQGIKKWWQFWKTSPPTATTTATATDTHPYLHRKHPTKIRHGLMIFEGALLATKYARKYIVIKEIHVSFTLVDNIPHQDVQFSFKEVGLPTYYTESPFGIINIKYSEYQGWVKMSNQFPTTIASSIGIVQQAKTEEWRLVDVLSGEGFGV